VAQASRLDRTDRYKNRDRGRERESRREARRGAAADGRVPAAPAAVARGARRVDPAGRRTGMLGLRRGLWGVTWRRLMTENGHPCC
jgi:hypothetical protein